MHLSFNLSNESTESGKRQIAVDWHTSWQLIISLNWKHLANFAPTKCCSKNQLDKVSTAVGVPLTTSSQKLGLLHNYM